MSKKIFIGSNYKDRNSAGDRLTPVSEKEIDESLNLNVGLDGVSKKGLITIQGKEYIIKNHSETAKESKKHSSILGMAKHSIQKRTKRVSSGTLDIRYRYTGTPIDVLNLTSMREALTSNMLMVIADNHAKIYGGEKPFDTAPMRLLVDQYPDTKLPRMRVLSYKTSFSPLDRFAYSAISGKKLAPYSKVTKQSKNPFAILHRNTATLRNPDTGNEETINISKDSMAFASILPAIFADYDIPGTNGNNLGLSKGSNKLTFFDFGNSLRPGWLKQRNITSDLHAHDFHIGGQLNQRRVYGIHRRSNLIRKFKGVYMTNAPLTDKMKAFKSVYNTFFDPHTGKESSIMKNIKSEISIQINGLLQRDMLTPSQYRYYRKEIVKSLREFKQRLKHIRKVLEPRIALTEQQLNTLETAELLASRTIPSIHSTTGFIFHKDSAFSGITHRHAFEFKNGKLITKSKEAAKKLTYFIHEDKGVICKATYTNGLYQFPSDVIPTSWGQSPHSRNGKQHLEKLISNTEMAQKTFLNHQILFKKMGGIELSEEDKTNCFTDDVLEVVNKIKSISQATHPSKTFQNRLIYQFLHTPCVDESRSTEPEQYHQTLWDVVHNIAEKNKNPRSSISTKNVNQLRLLDRNFSPEQFQNLFDINAPSERQR